MGSDGGSLEPHSIQLGPHHNDKQRALLTGHQVQDRPLVKREAHQFGKERGLWGTLAVL